MEHPTKLPDYPEKLAKLMALLHSYNVSGILLLPETLGTVLSHKNRDFEDDDIDYQIPLAENYLMGSYLVIKDSWELNIGNQTYRVLSANLNSNHGWCQWKLSMVNIKTLAWHSLDIRLL